MAGFNFPTWPTIPRAPAHNSGVIITFDQCTSCGNPGLALPILANTASGSGSAALGFINTTCSYNPSARAIASISASVDKDLSTSEAVTGFGNSFHPTIEQDGAFYVASIPGPTLDGTTTGYNTLAQSGLTAADFQKYDFSTGSFVAGVPNFAGDPMLFGLSQLFTLDTVPGFVAEADYDNLVISVNTVPELSTWTMICSVWRDLASRGIAKRKVRLVSPPLMPPCSGSGVAHLTMRRRRTSARLRGGA